MNEWRSHSPSLLPWDFLTAIGRRGNACAILGNATINSSFMVAREWQDSGKRVTIEWQENDMKSTHRNGRQNKGTPPKQVPCLCFPTGTHMSASVNTLWPLILVLTSWWVRNQAPRSWNGWPWIALPHPSLWTEAFHHVLYRLRSDVMSIRFLPSNTSYIVRIFEMLSARSLTDLDKEGSSTVASLTADVWDCHTWPRIGEFQPSLGLTQERADCHRLISEPASNFMVTPTMDLVMSQHVSIPHSHKPKTSSIMLGQWSFGFSVACRVTVLNEISILSTVFTSGCTTWY